MNRTRGRRLKCLNDRGKRRGCKHSVRITIVGGGDIRTIQREDPVHMIRHDLIGVDFGIREMEWDLLPTLPYKIADGVRKEFSFSHIAKNVRAILSADRHEVQACTTVVAFSKAQRFSVSHEVPGGEGISRYYPGLERIPNPWKEMAQGLTPDAFLGIFLPCIGLHSSSLQLEEP